MKLRIKALIPFLAFSLALKAQRSGYGISLGMNHTNILVEGRQVTPKPLINPAFGIAGHGRLAKNIGLLSEMSINFLGASIEDSTVSSIPGWAENKYKVLSLRYLFAPTYTFAESFFLMAGLSLDLCRPSPVNSYADENITYTALALKKQFLNAGITLGGGYTFRAVRLDLRYYKSFRDISDLEDNQYGVTSAKAYSIGIYMTYIFNSGIRRED